MQNPTSREPGRFKAPPEMVNILGTSGAILAVVSAGSAIVSVLPDPNVWQFAAAYGAPAGLAFAAYWWIAQKL
jgi:hypothetical protein